MSASIDSRTLRPGEVFYALRSERAGGAPDGHDFVAAALDAGASSAVVAESELDRFPIALRPRLRPVADPLRALQDDAHAHRLDWGGPLIAITGSAGKTTTKEMLAAALSTRLRVRKSEGNLNNHLGVPLTLLRLDPTDQIAVVEMGMNHAGEIAALAAIAAPSVAVFTNVGVAHLGNFDSIDAIAEAKRELARALPLSGTVVLNADDRRVARFADGFAGHVVFYRASQFRGALQYPGPHNRANAAAAVAAASLFGVPTLAAEAALAALAPQPGRGQIATLAGLTVINDCYNANPAAMEQMLGVLAATSARRRLAVLGEMRELGPASGEFHRDLGRIAARSRLHALLAVGGDARYIIEGAREHGFSGPAEFYSDAHAAAAALPAQLRPGDAILVKGSRAVHLEAVIEAVTMAASEAGAAHPPAGN